MSKQALLVELGTEELPVKALPGLAQAFFDGVIAALEKRGVGFERGDAKPLYTPRRLAVLLPAVDVEQPEQTSEVLGLLHDHGRQQHRQAARRVQRLGIATLEADATLLQRGDDAVEESLRQARQRLDRQFFGAEFDQ